MHDAWNLAWKLAFVVKGWGPDALLDSFAAERRKLGADLDARIDRTFRFITEPKPFQASIVRTMVPKLLETDAVKHFAEPAFTELELTYAGVGLSEGGKGLGAIKPGDRAAALWVKRLPECETANLLDLYDGLRWTLLVVVSAGTDASTLNGLVAFAKTREAEHPQQLRTVLLSCGPARPATTGLETMIDAESRFIREHDLPESCVLLVRPDGHVAVLSRDDHAEMETYLDKWLRPASHDMGGP